MADGWDSTGSPSLNNTSSSNDVNAARNAEYNAINPVNAARNVEYYNTQKAAQQDRRTELAIQQSKDVNASRTTAYNTQQAQQDAAASWQAALDDSLAKNLGTQAPTAAPRTPSAPVDTRTQAQREADFFSALEGAQAAAKAGDPTKLKNFDKMFNISRDPAEYSQSFYYGSSPNEQIKLINDMPISQEMKTKVIAEKLAIQAGARENDSAENIVAWFNAGGPTDPRTEKFLAKAENRNKLINATNVSQEMKTKIIAENLAIQAGVRESDSVSNLINWFNAGGQTDPRTAKWASSANPQNQIAVVNATGISQDFKNKVVAEIKAGSNTSDSVSDKISWFERGNPSSAAALAILNPPPPPPPAAESKPKVIAGSPSSNSSNSESDSQAAKKPEPKNEDKQSDRVFDKGGFGPNLPNGGVLPNTAVTKDEKEYKKDKENKKTASNVRNNNSEDAVLASTQSKDSVDKKEKEDKKVNSAAQAEADEKQQQALAVATANKQSAKEARLKKIMEMRKPYMGGAASVTSSSDAMVVPPIVPASQVPPPPLP